jgi:tetratricopeptide (TPR) repeat protein
MFAGHPEKALPHVERAAAMDGSSSGVSTAYWALGSCYSFLGNAEEGLAWLLKARAKNGLLPWVRLRLAATFGQLGELDEARKELDAARALVAPAMRPGYATLSVYRAQPQFQHPQFVARQAPALYAGLAKAGMPEA